MIGAAEVGKSVFLTIHLGRPSEEAFKIISREKPTQLRKLTKQHTAPVLLFISLALITACATSSRIEPTSAPLSATALLSRDDRIEIFEDVWKTINEQYYDPSFHGVNWQEVHGRYRSRVEAAKNDVEFYRLFEEMLAVLRDAHTVFIHPQSNTDNSINPPGSVGISLGEVEGKTAITAVEADSDAARLGVKPGMILRSVNGRSVEKLFAEIRSQFAGSSSDRSMTGVMHGALLYGGFLGASRTFGIEKFDGNLFDLPVVHFGTRPSDSPTLQASRLASGYGYIKFDVWKPPVDEQFRRNSRS